VRPVTRKAERIECIFEQQVLLEAIAATTVAHHFLLQRLGIEANRPSHQRIQVFEGDGLAVPNVDGGKRSQVRRPLARIANALEMGVEIKIHEKSLCSPSVLQPITRSENPRDDRETDQEKS
jgi:hypothetical protein